jgi:hypothetical protein
MQPPICWGEPTTLEGLVWILRGGEFVQTRLLADAGVAWSDQEILPRLVGRLGLALGLLLGEFVPMMTRTPTFARILALGLLGLMTVGWWRSRFALRWALPVVVAADLAVVAAYNIADFQPYLLPAISVAWFWLAFGLLWVAEQLEDLFLRRRFTYTPLVLGLLPLWLCVRFWAVCDRSQDERAGEWAAGILKSVEPGALVLTRTDGDTYAMWYSQLVDGVRPDVTVFGSNFMWSDWYRGFFTEEEARALYFEALDRPPAADHFLIALAGGIIAPNLEAGRPVYACFNLYESPQHELATIWPLLFQDEYYEIEFLGHTREPGTAHTPVGPPPNPLLPAGWAESMGRLGEPPPQLYRLVDNPALSDRARRLFADEVAPGHGPRLRRGVRHTLPSQRFLDQGTR